MSISSSSSSSSNLVAINNSIPGFNPFTKPPLELTNITLSFLGASDLSNVAATCREAHLISETPKLWMPLCAREGFNIEQSPPHTDPQAAKKTYVCNITKLLIQFNNSCTTEMQLSRYFLSYFAMEGNPENFEKEGDLGYEIPKKYFLGYFESAVNGERKSDPKYTLPMFLAVYSIHAYLYSNFNMLGKPRAVHQRHEKEFDENMKKCMNLMHAYPNFNWIQSAQKQHSSYFKHCDALPSLQNLNRKIYATSLDQELGTLRSRIFQDCPDQVLPRPLTSIIARYCGGDRICTGPNRDLLLSKFIQIENFKEKTSKTECSH